MLTKRDLLRSATAIAAGAAIARPSLLMAQSYPDLVEAKDIAEEGFIYGLPLVMNYAVMQEFAVDKNSGQFKAPFNEINNMHHVATPADTAVITPNSDTPYSILWLDLRAEPMVISVPAIERDRYYSVQLIDGNTYNFGYIGTRATGTEPGDYLVVGPDWKGGTPIGIKKVFRSTTPFTFTAIRTQLFVLHVRLVRDGIEQPFPLGADHQIVARLGPRGARARSSWRRPGGVAGRCRQVTMAEQHLDDADVGAGFE